MTPSNAEKQLQHEAVMDWMKDIAPLGVFTTDEKLVVQSWNRWLEMHSGLSEEHVVGKPLLKLWPELTARRLDLQFQNALSGQISLIAQRFHGFLLPFRLPSGANMQQTARIAPLTRSGEVIGTITTIEDVTERLEREAQLHAARVAAEKANHGKDEFLAMLSHELRTPLSAVIGWANLLRTRTLDAATTTRAVESIHRNSQIQAQLIEDLLDVSRVMSGKLNLDVTLANPGVVIQNAIDSVRQAADDKSVVFDTILPPKEQYTYMDVRRLQQVIWNLLSNAIKFSPAGSMVEVRLAYVENEAVISVRDWGAGIPANFLPHVFERFQQAETPKSRQQGGLGLGLAIVRHLVGMHRGTVMAHSAGEGTGATFTVRLPLDFEPEKKKQDQDPLPLRRSLEGICAVVVEDMLDSYEVLKTSLEAKGIKVVAAATAKEAVAAIRTLQPDIILADIGLPDEDGCSLIRRVRAFEPALGGLIPAIAITAHTRSEDRDRALSAGFTAYLHKPVNVEELLDLIASLVPLNRAPAQPNTARHG
jgi:PAS domain S-box-containing protein